MICAALSDYKEIRETPWDRQQSQDHPLFFRDYIIIIKKNYKAYPATGLRGKTFYRKIDNRKRQAVTGVIRVNFKITGTITLSGTRGGNFTRAGIYKRESKENSRILNMRTLKLGI